MSRELSIKWALFLCFFILFCEIHWEIDLVSISFPLLGPIPKYLPLWGPYPYLLGTLWDKRFLRESCLHFSTWVHGPSWPAIILYYIIFYLYISSTPKILMSRNWDFYFYFYLLKTENFNRNHAEKIVLSNISLKEICHMAQNSPLAP